MTYWYAYGLTPADYTVVAGPVDEDTGTYPVLFKPGTITGWNQKDAGAQVQLAADADGATLIPSVSSSTGADDYLPGTATTFYSQQPSLWIDGNGGSGPRLFMMSREAADLAVALGLQVANNSDAVTALNAKMVAVVRCVRWNGSAYPDRPASAGETETVEFEGPVPPVIGTGPNARDGVDRWIKTPL